MSFVTSMILLLINVASFFFESESQPVFTKWPPSTSYVVEGNGLFLQWNYTLGGAFRSAEFDLSAIPEAIDIADRFKSEATFIHTDYQGRVEANITATQANVTFLSLTRADTGNYVFKVEREDRKKNSSTMKITVQFPPEFRSSSGDKVVVEGTDPSDITLECNADGEPTPNITWTKVYDNGSDSGVLETKNQFVLANNRTSSGTYRCTAYNGIGTAPNRTVKVEVNFKPENVKLVVNDSTLCEGDVISITCSADGKPAVHSYQLFENGIQVNDGNSSAGVWIRKDLKEGDLSYRCEANNTIDTTGKTVNVTVKVPSKVYPLENITVIEGENRTLVCNVSGSPLLDVTWTEVNPGSQSNVKNMLYLTNISRNDAGEYKCKATNDCGNSSASTFLTVYYKPENFKFTVSKSTVCQGTVVTFNCSADGIPLVDTYQLLENDKPVSDGSNRLGMWTRNMSTGGVFKYKCMANNSAGTAYSMRTVTVNVSSSIQEILDQNVTEGNNLTLTCNVSGIPTPVVSWIKPDGQRFNESVLELLKVSRNQSGTYRCEASNDCGNAVKTASVEVQYKPENVQLMSSATNYKACRGDVISFNCSADANPAVVSYQLFENETAILNTSATGMWSKTLENEGVFLYKCVAHNKPGSMYSTNVMLTVNVPSSIIQITQHQSVTEGDNVTLLCNVSGVPPPMVYWVKPNGSRNEGLKLEVKNVKRKEAGEYKCEASNECGNSTKMTRIDVQFKPENVQLNSSAVNKKACKGKVITFNCSADAYPAVTSYQLFENETAIFNTSVAGMWSKTLENEGVFVYKCVANNSLGSGNSSSVAITVNVPSSIIQITQDQNVTEGVNVTLACNVSGVPPPIVSWIKPNGDRHVGYLLEVTNISRNEAGEYKCEASNECGNATEMAEIGVLCKCIIVFTKDKPENVQFTTSAMDKKACRNNMISFNCSADANPSVTSYQLFENDTILDTNPSGMFKRNVSMGGVFMYKCVANNPLGSKFSSSLMVTVNVPSTIKTIQDKNVTEGENATLTCTAFGMPQPSVSWIKLNDQNVAKNVLEFVNISRNEAGKYKCEASNECGNATEMATIDVNYQPENMKFRTSVMKSKVCQGDTITFNCSADAKPAVTSYQLLENGNVKNHNLSGMWKETLESGGVFVYKCVANNTVGSADSVDVTFTVNVPSSIQQIHNKTVTEGHNVTLMCNVSGMPPPTVSWLKPNGQLHSGYMLEFVNISRNEAGEYKCEASNECGNATEMATIDVQYPSRITNISGEQIVNNGDVVSLFCMAEGNPVPTITWTKVGDSSPVNFPLTISGNQDEGLYRCTAENGVGSSVTSDVNMTVHFPASIVAIGNHTVVKGETIVLYCNVSGTPPPTVLWTHIESGKTWNRKEWTIEGIQVGNLGEYRCNASNKYGGDIKSTLILYEGGFCEEPCPTRQLCRKFGKTYVCSCRDGEKGPDCKEKEEPKKTFEVGLKIKREFKQEYEDLENPETKSLVKEIKENTMVEFQGTGLASVKVLKLRPGSIIADLELTFNKSVGQSSVNALLTQARKDGKLGNMEVEDAVVGGTFPDTSEKDCGTFFEGEDCKKGKN
ncbi:hemicentin-2-like isoform X1 [Stylophora pistillata]|uniref:hemicentin-2-like isoform X1 n=1 Tax=Stylophora pistillata TaxID=50429 RepID=UPI000C04874A|nr:hemicentin-2-like isoform X1 [Stylophora pistillata]